jgi:hypothetical protein
MNIVSFVDRDMVMRYFGGGIGHLKNTPPLQVPGFDPIDPSSDEMAVEDDDDDDDDPCSGANEDLGTVVQQPSRDVVMNGGRGELVQLEVGEDDEDDKDDEENDEDSDDDDSEGGDQTDEEDEEGEDDYGYASA